MIEKRNLANKYLLEQTTTNIENVINLIDLGWFENLDNQDFLELREKCKELINNVRCN